MPCSIETAHLYVEVRNSVYTSSGRCILLKAEIIFLEGSDSEEATGCDRPPNGGSIPPVFYILRHQGVQEEHPYRPTDQGVPRFGGRSKVHEQDLTTPEIDLERDNRHDLHN